jgi:uncharacterized protein YraI
MKSYLAAALAGLATISALTTPAAASVHMPAFNCIQNPSADSNRSASFTGSGVNIRTGPDTSCTSIGLGYPGQSVTAHCTQAFVGANIWIYLTDNTTGKTGWSDFHYLSISGSLSPC